MEVTVTDPIHAVVMPKWGLSMEEGTIVAWLADEGATVAPGADLVEIETSKINNVMESPAGGTLRRRVVDQGQTVSVGALLAVIAEPAVDQAQIDLFITQHEVVAAEGEPGPSASAEPQTIAAGGCQISFVTAGAGPGPPVLFVHGFGGDVTNWMFNQPALAQNHLTYACDLPGHGRSSKQIAAGDVVWLAGVVADFFDQIDADKVHLVGHSLGAAVCLHAALGKPDRAASLTLICPAGLSRQINIDYIHGFIGAERRKAVKSVLATLFADPDRVNRQMVQDVLRYKRLDGVATALKTIAAVAFKDGYQAHVQADRLGELQEAKVRTQIIWGSQDQIITPVEAAGLPTDLHYHLVDDAGHMVHLEQSAQVNELIGGLVGAPAA